MSLVDDLEKLNHLKESGALSEEEYQEAKTSLLAQSQLATRKSDAPNCDISTDENMWAMCIHLSQFSWFFFPLAGIVLPIILWQVKSAESELLDRHGRIVVNWVLTTLILGIVFFALCFVLVGIPLFIALVILNLIFPIIGAVKANQGEVWPYPCAIRFFKQD